jgi:hypothetical protein
MHFSNHASHFSRQMSFLTEILAGKESELHLE